MPVAAGHGTSTFIYAEIVKPSSLICDTPMLIDCLGTTEEFAALFSDRSVLQAMLRFEAALARSQARLGMIPQSAADATSAATADRFDAASIAGQARTSASVAIPAVHRNKTPT